MNKNVFYTILLSFLLLSSCQNNVNTKKDVNSVEESSVVKEDDVPQIASERKDNNLKVNKPQQAVIKTKPTNDENYSNFNKSKSGLLYKFYRQNQGNLLTDNDVIEIEMNYFLNDSLLFSTINFPKQFKLPVQKSLFDGDLYEGLLMMHVGDSASFVVRADSTFVKLWNTEPKGIKPTDVVRFDIVVLSKENMSEFTQKRTDKMRSKVEASRNDLQVYLHDNEIYNQPRSSGLIVVPIIEGYGRKAVGSDKVKVHYTATLLNGSVYQSTRNDNAPVTLTLGNLGSEYPRGLDEALHQMHEGDITKFIIPYHLAFGQEEKPGVPAFSNFIFEVELLEIIE